MTEFILAITEFYALNTDGFAHLMQMAISSGLVRWRILCILISFARDESGRQRAI